MINRYQQALHRISMVYKCRLSTIEEKFGSDVIDELITDGKIEIYEGQQKFVVAGQVHTTDKIKPYVRLVK